MGEVLAEHEVARFHLRSSAERRPDEEQAPTATRLRNATCRTLLSKRLPLTCLYHNEGPIMPELRSQIRRVYRILTTICPRTAPPRIFGAGVDHLRQRNFAGHFG